MANRKAKAPVQQPGANTGPQRRTLERLEMAERSVVEAKAAHKPLGREMLEELMLYGRGLMGRYQPGGQTYGDGSIFWKAYYLTIRAAAALAPYQSPTYRAVYFSPEVVNQAAVSEEDARRRMRELLTSIAPDIVDDDSEPEEAELIMTNGGGMASQIK